DRWVRVVNAGLGGSGNRAQWSVDVRKGRSVDRRQVFDRTVQGEAGSLDEHVKDAVLIDDTRGGNARAGDVQIDRRLLDPRPIYSRGNRMKNRDGVRLGDNSSAIDVPQHPIEHRTWVLMLAQGTS